MPRHFLACSLGKSHSSGENEQLALLTGAWTDGNVFILKNILIQSQLCFICSQIDLFRKDWQKDTILYNLSFINVTRYLL